MDKKLQEELAALVGDAQDEQTRASLARFARLVTHYYQALVAEGMPEPRAYQHALAYQTHVVQYTLAQQAQRRSQG